MPALHLIRHGQAGLRSRYDTLSDLGRRQARLLGKQLVAQRVEFAAACSGRLARQRLTAEIVAETYAEAGLPFPEIAVEPLWDEFDLDEVYREVAPALASQDPGFGEQYERMLEALADERNPVHRRHHECDIAVVRAWVAGSVPYSGESWPTFRDRIHRAAEVAAGLASGEKTAVFTSATPIAVTAARALGLDENNLWRLAGVTYNSSVTTFRATPEEIRLFTFNALPHLPDPALWSFR